jgi:hypothetical protein
MLSGALSLAPSFGSSGKRPPNAPKKYRKESEKERRERQAKRGSK